MPKLRGQSCRLPASRMPSTCRRCCAPRVQRPFISRGISLAPEVELSLGVCKGRHRVAPRESRAFSQALALVLQSQSPSLPSAASCLRKPRSCLQPWQQRPIRGAAKTNGTPPCATNPDSRSFGASSHTKRPVCLIEETVHTHTHTHTHTHSIDNGSDREGTTNAQAEKLRMRNRSPTTRKPTRKPGTRRY